MVQKHKYYKPKRRRYNLTTPQKRLQYPQAEKKINAAKIKKIISAIFFCSSFIWFVYFFLLSNIFLIKTIEISGNKNIAKNDLEKIAREQLKQKKWLVFPNKNIFLFDKGSLISDIEDKYIIEYIKINRKLPSTIKIELKEKLARVILHTKTQISITQNSLEPKEREGKEIILKDDVSHNTKDREEQTKNREDKDKTTYLDKYYYLDVNGIVVSSGSDIKNSLQKFPVIEIETPSQTKINSGDTIISRKKIEFVFKAYEMLRSSKENILLDHISLDPKKDKEMAFTTKEGWQGFLSTQISLETQIKKLELALERKIKDKRSTLQYVDLRIKDRVYFK